MTACGCGRPEPHPGVCSYKYERMVAEGRPPKRPGPKPKAPRPPRPAPPKAPAVLAQAPAAAIRVTPTVEARLRRMLALVDELHGLCVEFAALRDPVVRRRLTPADLLAALQAHEDEAGT